VLQRTFPGLEQVGSVVRGALKGFSVAEGADIGCAEGGAERLGEDSGEDEGNRDKGGESVGSTHAKKLQRVSLACFL
jgi:hypothetical protein